MAAAAAARSGGSATITVARAEAPTTYRLHLTAIPFIKRITDQLAKVKEISDAEVVEVITHWESEHSTLFSSLRGDRERTDASIGLINMLFYLFPVLLRNAEDAASFGIIKEVYLALKSLLQEILPEGMGLNVFMQNLVNSIQERALSADIRTSGLLPERLVPVLNEWEDTCLGDDPYALVILRMQVLDMLEFAGDREKEDAFLALDDELRSILTSMLPPEANVDAYLREAEDFYKRADAALHKIEVCRKVKEETIASVAASTLRAEHERMATAHRLIDLLVEADRAYRRDVAALQERIAAISAKQRPTEARVVAIAKRHMDVTAESGAVHKAAEGTLAAAEACLDKILKRM